MVPFYQLNKTLKIDEGLPIDENGSVTDEAACIAFNEKFLRIVGQAWNAQHRQRKSPNVRKFLLMNGTIIVLFIDY
jgi:hypothetical protein